MPLPVYSGIATEYDRLLGGLARRTWLTGILTEVASLELPENAVVIDLGAGTGIGGALLSGMSTAWQLIGVDRSSAMLAQAADHYGAVHIGDIAQLPLRADSADLFVAGFDSLNYLPAEQLDRCLAEARRCLRPGGKFIFDYSSPHLLRDQWRSLAYDQQIVGDGTLAWCHEWDSGSLRSTSQVRRFGPDGELRWAETHTQYAFDAYELGAACSRHGLRVERVRDLERQDFTPMANTHVWTLAA